MPPQKVSANKHKLFDIKKEQPDRQLPVFTIFFFLSFRNIVPFINLRWQCKIPVLLFLLGTRPNFWLTCRGLWIWHTVYVKSPSHEVIRKSGANMRLGSIWRGDAMLSTRNADRLDSSFTNMQFSCRVIHNTAIWCAITKLSRYVKSVMLNFLKPITITCVFTNKASRPYGCAQAVQKTEKQRSVSIYAAHLMINIEYKWEG